MRSEPPSLAKLGAAVPRRIAYQAQAPPTAPERAGAAKTTQSREPPGSTCSTRPPALSATPPLPCGHRWWRPCCLQRARHCYRCCRCRHYHGPLRSSVGCWPAKTAMASGREQWPTGRRAPSVLGGASAALMLTNPRPLRWPRKKLRRREGKQQPRRAGATAWHPSRTRCCRRAGERVRAVGTAQRAARPRHSPSRAACGAPARSHPATRPPVRRKRLRSSAPTRSGALRAIPRLP